MTKFLVFLCLLPVSALAAPVDTSAADLALVQGSYAVGLVGGGVLGVYALLSAYKSLRSALGFTGMDSSDLAPPPWAAESEAIFAEGNRSEYLSNLAERLAAEDEALGIEFRDLETGKTNLDYMLEAGLHGEVIDRSQHSEKELAAYDEGFDAARMREEREEIFLTVADMDDGGGMGDGWEPPAAFSSFAEASAAFNAPGAEAAAKNYAVTTYAASTLAGYEWSSDEDGLYRMASINVNGVDRSYRIDYADELASASEDARFDFERNDGLTSAERSSLKEIGKSHDMDAMRDQ